MSQSGESERACNTSVNMHPEGILPSVLLQVHAAISLSFLATHTLATWSRCLLLPGIRWFIVTSHFPDSSQVCIAFLYHKLVVSCLTCCEMTPHSYKIHQTSSVPQMHFQNGSKETFIYIYIYIYNYNCKQSFIRKLKMCNAKSNSLVFKTCWTQGRITFNHFHLHAPIYLNIKHNRQQH